MSSGVWLLGSPSRLNRNGTELLLMRFYLTCNQLREYLRVLRGHVDLRGDSTDDLCVVSLLNHGHQDSEIEVRSQNLGTVAVKNRRCVGPVVFGLTRLRHRSLPLVLLTVLADNPAGAPS